MNLALDKFYVTLDGCKVRLYSFEGQAPFTVHGAYKSPCLSGWVAAIWKENGEFDANDYASPKDIVGPWIEKPQVNWSAMPAWAQWVAQDKGKDWYFYRSKPSLNLICWGVADFWGRIPREFAPVFGGDWKDSLVERK